MPRSRHLASWSFAAVAWATAQGCGNSQGGSSTTVPSDDAGQASGGGAGSDLPGSSGSRSDPAGSSGDASSSSDSASGGGNGSTSDSGALDSGSGSQSASGGSPDGATAMHAGNPYGSCHAGLPAAGRPVDTSHPTTVVGRGTAASCTFSQLQAAVARGGVITFDCGSAPTTMVVTSTLDVPTGVNTVLDGGGVITLDGGSAVQILSFNGPSFQANDNRLTLQHISLVNGKKTPTKAIPNAPAPCSQGWNDGQGGALYMNDGNLTVIDAVFTNNQAAPLGPDTGGGAIYILGSKHGALIVGSTFANNMASNAGAVGGLFSTLEVYDSLFTGNKAVGNGANGDEPKKCSVKNNGQNETGSGGNGGAIYSDGNSVNIALCGDEIDGNAAGTGAYGGGVFFTSNNMMGTLTIADTTMKGNTGQSWTNVATGSVKNAGTAIATNAKSITVTNSMLQGYP